MAPDARQRDALLNTLEHVEGQRAGEARGKSSQSARLMWYVLGVATLAFTGRAAPLAFLPLVLKDDFKQSDQAIGLAMAVYPLAALLATPWAAKRARASVRIVTMHSIAIIVVAGAMFLTSFAEFFLHAFGPTVGIFWVVFCRAAQGMGASLYLSSNTSLIVRKFADKTPYVIAMTEVAVGSGGQLGRLTGGFLYQFGGFACPFCVIALLQCLIGIGGFAFEDAPVSSDTNADDAGDDNVTRHEKLPWLSLATPRLCVGAVAPFITYFIGCFGDATLLQYLVVHLAPVTVGTLSVAMSTRGMTYLFSSYFIAQLMHRELVSYERLIATGVVLAFVGQLLIAPQEFVTAAESIESSAPPKVAVWSTQILSFVVAQIGGALMFVPSLPLMQSEARPHGSFAVEQVCELFVTMMTLGEMCGPIFGGWLVGKIGFPDGTLVLAFTCLPLLVAAVLTYDPAVVKARRGAKHHSIVQTTDVDVAGYEDMCICGPQCAPKCGPAGLVTDGEASFAIRRIPFALDVKRAAVVKSNSAPGTPTGISRRSFDSPTNTATKPWDSAPSETFRRPYVPPSRVPKSH